MMCKHQSMVPTVVSTGLVHGSYTVTVSGRLKPILSVLQSEHSNQSVTVLHIEITARFKHVCY